MRYLVIGLIGIGLIAGVYFVVSSNNNKVVEITPTPTSPQAAEASETAETESFSTDPSLAGEEPPSLAKTQFKTDFSKHSISYDEILSGGPPKDGIPAIDRPNFISVPEANDWLHPKEPVILLEIDGAARAYPIQILVYHEIVNDEVNGKGVSITYCPLCNTAIGFKREFEGTVLDFGTTGLLRFSNLVMYDRQTETWWQQATGEGIAGEHTGKQLKFVPITIIAWEDFANAYPEGDVLSRKTGYSRSYGTNPYARYDNINNDPFLYVGPETPSSLPAMTRVITVDRDSEAVAYPYPVLQKLHVINDMVAGEPIAVFWGSATASPLDDRIISEGNAVGSAAVYSPVLDGQVLAFRFEDGQIIDAQSNSVWNVLGQAVSGPLQGSRLESVVSINHFWFSWAAFRPETKIYQEDGSKSGGVEPTASASQETGVDNHANLLPADFMLTLYQNQMVLGKSSLQFSEIFSLGKPVVLNFWAGLCPFCRMELPHLQEFQETFADEVIIIGVDIGPFVGLGNQADAVALLEELQIDFLNGHTEDISAVQGYEVFGTPATYFILPSGEILQKWVGFKPKEQLLDDIEYLIEHAAENAAG